MVVVEIFIHALYQIQTNLKDRLIDDKQKLEKIKSIVKESLAYYERNVDK